MEQESVTQEHLMDVHGSVIERALRHEARLRLGETRFRSLRSFCRRVRRGMTRLVAALSFA